MPGNRIRKGGGSGVGGGTSSGCGGCSGSSIAGSSMCASQSTSEGETHSTSEYPVSEGFMDRMQALQCALESDLLACDAKWTLFVAAALSYRYDALLRPFPPRYVSDQNGYNIDALVSVINDTPKLSVVLRGITDQNFVECDADVLELLHWVLVELHNPKLRPLEDDEYDSLFRCFSMNQIINEPDRPTHVFELCQSYGGHASIPHNNPDDETPQIAFYGNKLDSFFSIINFGFAQHQCAANKFMGKPIVLKKQLSACLCQSPIGAGWGASCCGSMIACIAVCEFLPDQIQGQLNPGENSSCGGGGDATGEDADIVIGCPDTVRVRYLLFYGSRFAEEEPIRKTTFFTWIAQHKYTLSLAAYMLMLASIGVANSGGAQYIKHLLSRKASLVLEFWKRIFVTD